MRSDSALVCSDCWTLWSPVEEPDHLIHVRRQASRLGQAPGTWGRTDLKLNTTARLRGVSVDFVPSPPPFFSRGVVDTTQTATAVALQRPECIHYKNNRHPQELTLC